jgi:hypothetical protein
MNKETSDYPISTPAYAYIVAVILGLVIPLAANVVVGIVLGTRSHGSGLEPTPGIVLTMFGVLVLTDILLGLAFGYTWPRTGWKWGLWLIPLFFAWMVGGGGLVLVPILMTAGGCAGGFAGARLRNLVDSEK